MKAAIMQSADPARTRTLLALAGDQVAWEIAFSPRATTSDAAFKESVESVVSQADLYWIDKLLLYSEKHGTDFGVAIATQWAPRQLSGDRLSYLQQRAQEGAFSGASAVLLRILLSNAEDKTSAAAIASGLGFAI
jgi:hypothetical protein